MRTDLRVVTWPIHGSYFNTLSHVPCHWLLPVDTSRAGEYGGIGASRFPDTVSDIDVASLTIDDVDVILPQAPHHLDDIDRWFGQSHPVPVVYLEHNTPSAHPVDETHPAIGRAGRIVHVTHFNRLMWDCGETPTHVVEHSVAIDPACVWRGEIPAGIMAVNSVPKRGRRVGADLLHAVRQRHVPIDLAGFGNEGIPSLGPIPYFDLHPRMARYRFLFSPCRYTSLPLAVIEAITIGMPVVALATTEVASALRHRVHGYISNDIDELVEGMHRLCADPDHAAELGANARHLAQSRFALSRFVDDWHRLLQRAAHHR
jgi:hypothetical protein